MQPLKSALAGLLLVFFIAFGCEGISTAAAADLGVRTVEIARGYSHVREATNRNDHPDIDKFLGFVGLNPGYAWCQAFYAYTTDQAYREVGLRSPFPRYASCAKTLKYALNNPLTLRCISAKQVAMGAYRPVAGDLASFKHGSASTTETYSYNGHAAMVTSWRGTEGRTIEGNTKPGPGGDQRGATLGDLAGGHDGVYERTRSLGIGSRFPILYFVRPWSWEVSVK